MTALGDLQVGKTAWKKRWYIVRFRYQHFYSYETQTYQVDNVIESLVAPIDAWKDKDVFIPRQLCASWSLYK